jgi:hypothetical protein
VLGNQQDVMDAINPIICKMEDTHGVEYKALYEIEYDEESEFLILYFKSVSHFVTLSLYEFFRSSNVREL